MKKLFFFFTIFTGMIIVSCSSDSDNSEEQDNNPTNIVFKKASSYNNATLSSTQEVFYNANKQVTQIVTDIDNGWRITTIDVIYDSNQVSQLTKSINYSNSNNNDSVEVFNVTVTNGQIRLTGINGLDKEIQIDYTDNYVDAIRTIQASNMMVLSEDTFTRDADNNISMHISSDMTFTYSDYSTGNVMPFHREYSFDYFIAFNLKTSKNLPLTETVTFSSGSSDSYSMNASLLTIDDNNNITNYGSETNYIAFEYIEL